MSIQESCNLIPYEQNIGREDIDNGSYLYQVTLKREKDGNKQEIFKRYVSVRGKPSIDRSGSLVEKINKISDRQQQKAYLNAYGIDAFRKKYVSEELYKINLEQTDKYNEMKLGRFRYSFPEVLYKGYDKYGEKKKRKRKEEKNHKKRFRIPKINLDDEDDIVLSWLKESRMKKLSPTDARYIQYMEQKDERRKRKEEEDKQRKTKLKPLTFDREKVELTSDEMNVEIINRIKNRAKSIRYLKPLIHTGAFAIFDTLVRSKISSVFGYPGGAILPIYDELFFWESQNYIKHYLVRHEQAATHAADGYSRSSGKVGVCFATSGPGATNLVTGIATAYMDSVPMIVVTGQVGAGFLGTDAFQEIDMYGITLSFVKHSYVVTEARLLSQIITEAIYISQNGRPGPVLIDIPKDIGLEKIDNFQTCNEINVHKVLGWRYKIESPLQQIYETLHRISAASCPLLYVGGGVVSSNASFELRLFAQHYGIPMTTTLMGKGAFDERDDLCLGMLGMHGSAYANYAIENCDLLIGIGARFDDRVTGKLEEFACKAFIIHIDCDESEMGKNKSIGLGIRGDIKVILTEFLVRLSRPEFRWYRNPIREKFQKWRFQVNLWREDYPLIATPIDDLLLPQEVIKKVTDLEPKAVVTTDVGQHQMWAAQYLKCKPRHWLSSAGLGTMGFGLPAAIGAAVAIAETNQELDSKVVCITGDSSFQMNLQELGTISKYNLPVKIIIVNNHWQGMVRQWQETFYEERYSHSSMIEGEPRFNILANAYGIKSLYSERQSEIISTLKEAFSDPNIPILLECNVVEKENCYPMVDPSKGNTEMFISRQLSTTKDGLIIDKEVETLRNFSKIKDEYDEEVVYPYTFLDAVQVEYIDLKDEYKQILLKKESLTPAQEYRINELIKKVKFEENRHEVIWNDQLYHQMMNPHLYDGTLNGLHRFYKTNRVDASKVTDWSKAGLKKWLSELDAFWDQVEF